MINFFHKLRLLFQYGPELNSLLLKERQELADESIRIEHERTKDHLQLCYSHQQENKHSHYGERNCDYCKLLNKMEGHDRGAKEADNG